MTVRAPLTGLVVIKENQDAGGNFGFMGMTLPDYRVGDTVQPGRSVAEIVDLTEMEIKTKISETERSSITAGASANVKVEALPGSPMNGASKGVGSPAQKAFWEPETSRQFNAAFALTSPSAALRPGMTARVGGTGTDVEERDSPAAPGAVRKGWEARRLHPRWQKLYASPGAGPQHNGERASSCATSPATSTWRSSTPRPRRLAARAARRPPRCQEPRDEPRRSAAVRGHRPSDSVRLQAWARDADGPQAALAVDHARHDLRRRGGGVDDVDRRRRPTAGSGIHRAVGRAEPDRRGARIHRLAGVPEDAKMSPGLTERDLRVIRANVPGINASTARKRYVPQKLIPRPQREAPQVFGVEPTYRDIAGLSVVQGRWISDADAASSAAVAAHRRRRED